jgi:ribosome-binding factor A
VSPPGQRTRRVNEALRHVLADAVRGLQDPRVESVTITRVQAAPDTTTARVFFTVFLPDRKEAAGAGLDSARGVLQGRVARELRTRHTPHLVFTYDEQAEQAERLTRLIDEVTADQPPQEDG